MNAARLLLAATLAAAGASAFALPQVQSAGKVEYMTGGVGEDESTAMLAQARHWPLTVEFAQKAGTRAEWMAGVDVTVSDTHGRTLLHATSDGPLLLARLAPGDYTVRGVAEGRTIEHKVHIAPREPARTVLVWPRSKGLG